MPFTEIEAAKFGLLERPRTNFLSRENPGGVSERQSIEFPHEEVLSVGNLSFLSQEELEQGTGAGTGSNPCTEGLHRTLILYVAKTVVVSDISILSLRSLDYGCLRDILEHPAQRSITRANSPNAPSSL